MMLKRQQGWDDGREGDSRKGVSAAAKGPTVLPFQLKLIVCLG